MSSYKELFSKSQAIIADTIENLESILENLKEHMLECEDNIISDKNNIIDINTKKAHKLESSTCR